MSNVVGPDKAMHIGGREIKQIVGFLPPPPGCPLGVAVTSYCDELQLSVNANRRTFEALRLDVSNGGGSGCGNCSAPQWRPCDAEEILARVSKRLQAIASVGSNEGSSLGTTYVTQGNQYDATSTAPFVK